MMKSSNILTNTLSNFDPTLLRYMFEAPIAERLDNANLHKPFKQSYVSNNYYKREKRQLCY